MSLSHRIEFGPKVRLRVLPTRADFLHDNRKQAEKETADLKERMRLLQRRLYAESKQQLLVVLQARDAGGKDGTIRKVFSGINPQGVRVHSFKVPTSQELAHDFLWRIHKRAPARGMIGVFNRSHYEDVLVVLVRNLAPEEVWRPRFEHINNFERMLTDSGTRILKLLLHISPDEQKERFQERLEDKEKFWKFSPDDLAKRELWDDYSEAFEEMLEQCSTPYASWHVIPADQKWYRNLAVTRAIVEALEEMDPQFPDPGFDPGDYQLD